jgi:hypothetical protein
VETEPGTGSYVLPGAAEKLRAAEREEGGNQGREAPVRDVPVPLPA